MKQAALFAYVFLPLLLAVGGVIGWFRNVINVIHSDFSDINGELVVRVIGIPVVPIGSVAGWFN
jgi:uncharacterized membrane protein (UPF0136 family)